MDSFPPIEQEQRFGNKAFRQWYDKLEEDYITYINFLTKDEDLIIELQSYFLDCFGSSKRIDYGTGHELNFLCILYILVCVKYFSEEDLSSIVHHVYYRYLLLCRKLQITYKLEPAGSRGIWGLDDFQFLCFAFGASELIDHKEILPSSITNKEILGKYSDDYMFLGCVKFILEVNILLFTIYQYLNR